MKLIRSNWKNEISKRNHRLSIEKIDINEMFKDFCVPFQKYVDKVNNRNNLDT